MSENTISRRSALRTGGLAAVAAGLLGSAGTAGGTAQAEAPPATVPTLGTVADLSALLAAVRTASDAINRADERAVALTARLRDTLSREQWDLVSEVRSADYRMQMAEEAWLVAALAWHLPGLSPAIVALADHFLGAGQPTGECCG